MELSIYDVIKGPRISDKAYKLNRTRNQLVLTVHIKANKPLIKDAIEKLFDVKVKSVRTKIGKKSSAKVMQRKYNATPKITRTKVAYVTLAAGYTLDLFEQTGAPAGDNVKKITSEN